MACLGLGACAAPGPGFRGVEARALAADGSMFVVRYRGALAEVTRVSFEPVPRFDAVARRAASAVARDRPGCRAAWIEGDAARAVLGLACDGRTAPNPPRRKALLLCDLFELTKRDGVVDGHAACRLE